MIRRLHIGFVTLICLGLLALPANAQRPVTIASLLGPEKPETLVWTYIAERLEERLPGQFDLRITGDAALGGEREVAEGARLGSIQGSLSTLANMSAWVPEGQIFDMPFIFRDADHIDAVMAGPIGADFLALYQEQGFQVLGYINYGARHLLSKQALTRPEELAGRSIRVLQSPLHTQLWESLGANPTPIPIPEVYNALQTGLVDMMDLTTSAAVGFRLHEVAPYFVETGHIWALGIIYLSSDFFESLTEEQQAAFLEIGSEAAAYFNELMAEDHARSMAQAEAEGAERITVDRRSLEVEVLPGHRRTRFQSAWVRVLLAPGGNRRRLLLASHGRELEIGAFLADEERAELWHKLRQLLAQATAPQVQSKDNGPDDSIQGTKT